MITRFVFICLSTTAIVVSFTNPCMSLADEGLVREELLSMFEGSMQLVDSLSPFDLIGDVSVVSSFEGGKQVASTQTIRFRLKADLEKKYVEWAVEVKDDAKKEAALEAYSVSFAVIDGDKIRTSTGSGIFGSPRTDLKIASFESLLDEAMVLMPKHWGLFKFPTFSRAHQATRLFAARMISTSNKVTRESQGDRQKFVLTHVADDGRRDVSSWDFDSGSLVPLSTSFKRAAPNDSFMKIFEQDISWDTVDGVLAPVLIVGDATALRQSKDPTRAGAFESGVTNYDAQISWLQARSPIAKVDPKRNFGSANEILKYLAEGKKLADLKTK